MQSLAEIYPNFASPASWGDRGTIHTYVEVYEEILAPYRAKTRCNVLEIGLMSGESLRMWEQYFHLAKVYGIDVTDQPVGGMADLRPIMAEGTHNISIIDATDQKQIDATFGNTIFDVIIEDASHALAHQLLIYQNFRQRLAYDGIYIIEDVDKIDEVRPLFEKIDHTRKVTILDRRHVKGRFDDVLVVIGQKV